MTEEPDMTSIMQSVAEKSLQLIVNAKPETAQLSIFIEQFIRLSTDCQALLSTLLKNPDQLWQLQMEYWQDAMELMQSNLASWLEGKTMPATDKRFSSDEWIHNPFFNLLSQQYLLASEHLNSMLAHLDYGDKKLAHRIQFFTRQYLDALSPDNFLHTNPQLLAETLQSHGKNLLIGLHSLLTDIESGSSRLIIKMTDINAFQIGRDLAVTPGHVIFQNELMELIQYTPQTAAVNAVPLLIIPPWINKYYILDLSPHNSLINWLVGQGITVFVISWINPDGRLAHKGIYDYLNEGPMTAIRIIQEQLSVKQINALGFCIGGTLLAMLLAYYTANKKNPVRSATFLAAMIDFSQPGDISVFIDEHQIVQLEAQMKEKGYLEGHFMTTAFNSLRSSDLIWSYFINNYLRAKAPVPFDMLYWNADATNMPEKMHSQYLRWMYLHNSLIKPNKIRLDDTLLDISTVNTPTFFISTKKDHIAPWKTVYLGYQLLQGEKHFLLSESGHIAGIINPPVNEKYGFYRNTQTEENAEAWLAHATYQSGSWWSEWLGWLKKQSGRVIKAPDLTQLPHPGIMAAPGSYVLLRCAKEAQDGTCATELT